MGRQAAQTQGQTRFMTEAEAKERRAASAAFREAKPTVLGMVERGGRVRARVIASRHGATLSRAVTANVNPESIIFTDDWASYKPLKRTYVDHKVINHSAGVYVEGDAHEHDRGILREPQDRDARRLQEGLAALLADVLERVHMALQRAPFCVAAVRAASRPRCQRSLSPALAGAARPGRSASRSRPRSGRVSRSARRSSAALAESWA